MFAQRHTIAIETDGSGDAVGYSPQITGRIEAIIYTKDDFADTVDFAITLEATGQSLWTDSNVTASETVYPVVPANLGADGSASSLTEKAIVAANDRVKFTIAQGGDTKSGTFHVVVS